MRFARPAPTRPGRRGAAMIETAIVLLVLLTMVFAMFDLGLAVLRRSIVAHSARQVARQASVHGTMGESRRGQWGPEALSMAANADDEIAAAARRYMSGLDLEQTTLELEWPDGDSEPESRVRVTVSTRHQPFVGFVFGSGAWTLSSSTTVQINH
jgi:Flp pilus assembly protein TadG